MSSNLLDIAYLRLHFNRTLKRHFPPSTLDLEQAMSYAALNEGKRMRPLLVYATGLALGAELERLDCAACSVELIHTYSLIHDDLPSMDDDDFRRGQPACHKMFGESTAILAGNALQNLAFQLLSQDEAIPPQTRVAMIHILTQACGVEGILGGQALDLKSDQGNLNVERVEQIHLMKTAALIRASVRLGALCAGCNEEGKLLALDQFARHFGLAFQIHDDMNDASEKASDALNYLKVVSLNEAKQRLASLYESAFQIIEKILPGEGSRFLKAVCSYCLRIK